MKTIADIRRDYMLASLNEDNMADDPFAQFDHWWADALTSQIDEVNAFTLCTVDAAGIPDGRIVLLKGYDRDGFVFYTNYRSTKGQQMADNPIATMVFFWKELERQVRITGDIGKVSAEESDAYFHSRPRESRLGAWVSAQSSVISNRNVLEEKFEQLQKAYQQEEPPRPDYWGGYRINPFRFEFWQGRPSRLHDRFMYQISGSAWHRNRLSP